MTDQPAEYVLFLEYQEDGLNIASRLTEPVLNPSTMFALYQRVTLKDPAYPG